MDLSAGPTSIGALTIDLTARRLRRDGTDVELTAREWRLLEYLAMRRGQIVPRAEIEALPGPESALAQLERLAR